MSIPTTEKDSPLDATKEQYRKTVLKPARALPDSLIIGRTPDAVTGNDETVALCNRHVLPHDAYAGLTKYWCPICELGGYHA